MKLKTGKIVPDEKTGLLLLNKWRDNGHKIVFTNGCFDILHLGHIRLLEQAKTYGDKMVLGINSDNSIRNLKGLERPVNDENSRLQVAAALEVVDLVWSFDELTPERLIKLIKPDVLVKGKDYEISNIVGAEIVMESGGRIETVELEKGYSTTKIIEKIKKLNRQ